MRIIRDRPPLYDLIDQAFNVRGKPIIFSWGHKIFVPTGDLNISMALMAHEGVHGARQLGYQVPKEGFQLDEEFRITNWWIRYIADIDFRREEEVLAHQAEYRHLCDHAGGRNQRRRHLSIIATKLSHPLYGPVMNKAEARKVLQDGRSTDS